MKQDLGKTQGKSQSMMALAVHEKRRQKDRHAEHKIKPHHFIHFKPEENKSQKQMTQQAYKVCNLGDFVESMVLRFYVFRK